MTMGHRRAVAAALAACAVLLGACVSADPNRPIDYSRVGFESDDGAR